MEYRRRKVVVIGAGAVGTTYIYAVLHTGIVDEIVLLDIDEKRVEGEVMDLSHGLPFWAPTIVRGGDYSDCRDADVIVLTAGAKQKPNQSRPDLIQENAEIVGAISEKIKSHDSRAILIMVTNPVDALTRVALKTLGWSRHRVIGSGTVLDTARFRFLLSYHCNVDARNVHGYIIGEHGDSEVAPWSLAHLAGVRIKEYCRICGKCNWEEEHKQIINTVRSSAYHIIDYKGSTFYGIGQSLTRITGAILRNEHSVLTVCCELKGEYGITDTVISVPCIVGDEGIVNILDVPLAEDEQNALHQSAQVVRDTTDALEV